MADQMQICPPFPRRVRRMMQRYLDSEGGSSRDLTLLIGAYTPVWREAWVMAHRSQHVTEIRASQGHRWKRALYECAVAALE